jgi:signal transduction histidine kinase
VTTPRGEARAAAPSAEAPARTGWVMLAPLLVAVASLLGLVLAMVVLQHRSDRLREEVATVAEPARAELNRFEAAISKEMSAQRGFMLFHDSAFIEDENRSRREEVEMDRGLDRLVGRLGGGPVAALNRLRDLTLRWSRSPGDPASVAGRPAEEARGMVMERQRLFEQVLDASRAVDEAIVAEERARLDEVARLDALRVGLAVVLVAVALGAVLSLVRVAARMRALGERARELAEQSELRRRALEEMAEEKGRFLRGITHDLKNPLGAIDAYAQLLEAGVRGAMPPEQLVFVGRIRRVTQECVGIIHDLLHLARAEARQLRIDPAPTDLAQLVHETAEDYAAVIQAGSFAFALDLPDDLEPVQTDGRRVREILGNLLSNALKHTPPGGRITVSVAHAAGEEGGWATLSVRDTGPGIAPGERERIFGEFQRLSPQAVQGSGIGLAISRQIAHLLGGELDVDGAPGGGAVFTLRLPRARTADPLRPRSRAGAGAG